jgi:hypothetical protein
MEEYPRNNTTKSNTGLSGVELAATSFGEKPMRAACHQFAECFRTAAAKTAERSADMSSQMHDFFAWHSSGLR